MDRVTNVMPGPHATRPDAANFVELLGQYQSGNQKAADQLMKIFYSELRYMAAAHLGRERAEHSWQPTVLLNELYLELRKVRNLRPVNDDNDRTAFLAFASHLMKRLLIHHARPLSQRVDRISMEEENGVEIPSGPPGELDIILSRLGALDPKLRDVVELKVFGGLTEPEIAIKLECAPRTVARYWQFARQWLQREFGGLNMA